MKRALTAFSLASVLLCAGCASMVVHFTDPPDDGEYHPRYVYGGTQVEAREISHTVKYIKSPRYGCDAFDPLWPVALGILVVDFPLTLAADTVLLPFDTYMVTLGGKAREWDVISASSQP